MTLSRIVVEVGVQMPMRDGVQLAADVYRPDTSEPVPVILMRTPYDRSVALTEPFYDGLRFVKAGYALVIQDTRGRYESGGVFYPFRTERQDGEDTIGWLTDAPWSNGRVGMIGASYPGAAQWLAATQNPPGLAAIAPIVTAADFRDGWIFHDGVFELGFSLQWSVWLAGDTARRSGKADPGAAQLASHVPDVGDRIESLYRGLDPEAENLLRRLTPYYFDWRPRPNSEGGWDSIAPDLRPELATAPALNIGGWYDVFKTGTVECYQRQRDAARTAGRPQPRLIMGPWTHSIYSGMFVGRRFGMRSAIGEFDLAGEQLRWFDRWLKGEANGVDEELPVRLFVMGTDRWQDFADFPPPHATPTELFVHTKAGGRGGTLETRRPDIDEQDGVVRFDPHDLVPTVGGGTLLEGTWVADRAGPADLRLITSRSDVLVYMTDPLERSMTIVGSVELRAHASVIERTKPTGFDLVAHLVDVHPSGRMEILTGGIRRLTPDSPAESYVKVGATAATFLPGHRVGLIVAASDFPRFEPNPDLTAAGGGTIRIGSSSTRWSRLILPVIDE